jgi:hypothetical protein
LPRTASSQTSSVAGTTNRLSSRTAENGSAPASGAAAIRGSAASFRATRNCSLPTFGP